ncbi:MAG: hypothetical protein KM310_00165 [Clostridiales bacterium]|nr:hypothetical protein [Clostridiales bacterium]
MFLSLDLRRYRDHLWKGVRPFAGGDEFTRWVLGRIMPVSLPHPEEEVWLWLGLMVVRKGKVAVKKLKQRYTALVAAEVFETQLSVERSLGKELQKLGTYVRENWRLEPFQGSPRFLAWIHDPWTPELRDHLALVAAWEVPEEAEARGGGVEWWSQDELDKMPASAWNGFSRWVPGLLRLYQEGGEPGGVASA